MRGKKLKILMLFLLLSLRLPGVSAYAYDAENYLYEQKIKAGILYNFLKFTSWPDTAIGQNGDRLTVCLFGGDPFDGYLYPLEGKTAQQHPISIIAIDDIHEVRNCGLVFVHHNAERSIPLLLSVLKDQPVLTVSDIKQFASNGGMVEMAMENERIRLYVNEEQANAAGIQISSNILKLARRVVTKKS